MKHLPEKGKTGKALPLLFAVLVAAAGALLLWPTGSTGTMTAEEMRISRTLSSIQGAGQTQISIYYAASSFGGNHPVGAVIVSEGAGDLSVKMRLMQAAQTLLGLDSGGVAVFEKEEGP